jgi:hypothetical protein
MFAREFHPPRFLRAVAGTEPFRDYCRLRGIPLDEPGTVGEADVNRWAAAVAALPADTQARIELELAQVNELAGRDGIAHLLDAAAGGDLPGDEDLPGRAAALGEELRVFFRQDSGTGRFCAVEAHWLPEAVCFAARVADRTQLVEGFTDAGETALQRVRPALAVLFAYCPGDGAVQLKSHLRSVDRVRSLLQCFGRAVLSADVAYGKETFDLDRLKEPFHPLPDAPDMAGARVKALSFRYPERSGRRQLRLEPRPCVASSSSSASWSRIGVASLPRISTGRMGMP